MTSHNFNSKEKLTDILLTGWLSGIPCSVQQRVPEVSYQYVISKSKSYYQIPSFLSSLLRQEAEGKGQLSLRMTDCCPLGFPDSWNRGCISKIHNTPSHFSPGDFRVHWHVSTCTDKDLQLSPLFCVFKLCMSLSSPASNVLAVPSLSFLARAGRPVGILSAVRRKHPEHLITSLNFSIKFLFYLCHS